MNIISGSLRHPGLTSLIASMALMTASATAAVATLTPDYAMQKRFQPDWRNPGAVTLPNSAAYAQPKDFLVTLKLGSAPANGTVYSWILKKGKETVNATGANPAVRLTAGTWNATVTGKVSKTVTSAGTRTVEVKDLLIVAIGDSYASGEGSPEIPGSFTIDGSYLGSYTPETLESADLNDLNFWDFPAVGSFAPTVSTTWARSATTNMTQENHLAHRSTLAYSARYAMALEQSDPHLSVTYVSVAQSGAIVSELLSTQNLSGDDGSTLLPIQLTELKKIVGNRKIDKLLISIGGNDAGFGPLIGKILASPVVYAGATVGFTGDFVDPISLAPKIATNSGYASYIPGNIARTNFPADFSSSNAPQIASNILTAISTNAAVRKSFEGFNNATNGLALSYGALNTYLRSLFTIDRIAITEYPDINRVYVQGSDGNPVLWWGAGVTDLMPTAAINPTEAMLATKLFAEPLNRLVSNCAASNNWLYVGGVNDAFAGHGYGAPKDTRWIVTARESVLAQGSTPDWYGQVFPLTSFGMAHQNSPGLVATARLVASRFGETNVTSLLSAEVTRNQVPVGSSTLATPVDLGEDGGTNDFLITDTTGVQLGVSNVAVTGGFSVPVQPSGTLVKGGSTNFSIINPSSGTTGLQTGIVTITFTNAGVPPYTFPVSAFNDAAAGTNWMSKVPDNQSLARMTLPGTHDTMALYESVYGTAICQNMTLGEQLTNGVRCLDIRGRHLNNGLAMHHGMVYQNSNFNNVLDATTSFLSNNPTETVVLLLKPEYDAKGNTRTYEETVKSYMTNYPSKYFFNGWNATTSIPTIGNTRGKIVLVRRFSGKLGIDATSWPDNPAGAVKVGPQVLAEDLYKFTYSAWDPYNTSNFDTKWSAVYDGLMQAFEDTQGNYLHLTYSSATVMYSPVFPQLRGLAENINPRLNGFFIRRPVGIYGAIMMDFATPDIIAKIYRSGLAALPN